MMTWDYLWPWELSPSFTTGLTGTIYGSEKSDSFVKEATMKWQISYSNVLTDVDKMMLQLLLQLESVLMQQWSGRHQRSADHSETPLTWETSDQWSVSVRSCQG